MQKTIFARQSPAPLHELTTRASMFRLDGCDAAEGIVTYDEHDNVVERTPWGD
jgi:hypothetical protein